MARGFLSGLVWGGIVAVGAAAGVSLLVPMGAPPDTVQTMPDAAAPMETALPNPAVPPAEDTAVARVETTPEPARPAPAPVSGAPADTDSAARPEVGASVAELATPPAMTGGETASSEPVQPAIGETTAATTTETDPAPATPAAQDTAASEETSISTDPAQPPAPAVPAVQSEEPTPQMAEETEEATPGASDPVEDTRIATLPQAGTDDPAPIDAAPADSEAADSAQDGAVPPVVEWAQPFDDPGDKPLMAIVLIDDAQSVGAEALAAFPSPMTIAVDPRLPDAPDRMARHRAAGFEVLALADLPEDAAPQDAEMAIGAILSRIPESIGVLEGPTTGIQGNRALADQVAAILRDRGYGLVTQDNGLNTVPKLAARDGVPTAVVFRDFDGDGQTPIVMRRFLDQAAFRAGQIGGVVMLGRVRPDTISALLLWGLQDRASRVTLAPVSAVLSTTPEVSQ